MILSSARVFLSTSSRVISIGIGSSIHTSSIRTSIRTSTNKRFKSSNNNTPSSSSLIQNKDLKPLLNHSHGNGGAASSSTNTGISTSDSDSGTTKSIKAASVNPVDAPTNPVERAQVETEPVKTGTTTSTNTSTSMPFMKQDLHEFAPRIVVVGVGGAGGNALNNMIAKDLQGVDFLALNTDAQHLSSTLTDQRLQLGIELTQGLGCGANPDAGRLAAEESKAQIQEYLKDAHLVFITAGMGGGTGTGAAPVVAEICYQMGILTVGVVTLPFRFEGTHRRRLALEGVQRLQSVVDTLIVIPNQNLFQIAGPETTFVDAFQMADDVLLGGVKSITDLMVCVCVCMYVCKLCFSR